jgi:hypothetical protein
MVYATNIAKKNPKKRVGMTALRRRLYSDSKGFCSYCWRKTILPVDGKYSSLAATVDHVIPLSRGGDMRGDNAILACQACNNLKKDMMPSQWQAFMDANPEWWRRASGTKPLPISESQMILREGKAAWWRWKNSLGDGPPPICPVITMVAEVLMLERYPYMKRWPGRRPVDGQ